MWSNLELPLDSLMNSLHGEETHILLSVAKAVCHANPRKGIYIQVSVLNLQHMQILMTMLTVLSHFFSQTCGWRHGWSHADVDRNLCTFWCVRMVRGGDCLAGKLLVFFWARLVLGCKAKRLFAQTFLLYGKMCVSKTCLQGFKDSILACLLARRPQLSVEL